MDENIDMDALECATGDIGFEVLREALEESEKRIAELEKDCTLYLDELVETRSTLRERAEGIERRGVELLQEKDRRIADLELDLADKTREDCMQIRHILECEGMIKELEEANREQARTIMSLVTNRNYLQAELNRVCKEKP